MTESIIQNPQVEKGKIQRVLGHLKGTPGPTIVFVGGIHGNEPSGVRALQQVIAELREAKTPICGELLAISGNSKALASERRFIDEDLNRIWSHDRVEKMRNGSFEVNSAEDQEQLEIFKELDSVLSDGKGPFYFMDLHTTSGDTVPFLTVNDSLANRRFTSQYPLPMVLGIEEYLNGPLLSYINELGYIAFGFEGGSHYDPMAVKNHRAFIYLSLTFAGVLKKEDIDLESHWNQLADQHPELDAPFEIVYRQWIEDDDKFNMLRGYVNFQKVQQGELLAEFNGSAMRSPIDGRIFMPLYQAQGNDAFFIIRKIPSFFLWLSAVLRKMRADRLLPLLPGVSRDQSSLQTLVVDKRIARFLTKPILHLLGFRYRETSGNKVIIKNREAASRDKRYLQ